MRNSHSFQAHVNITLIEIFRLKNLLGVLNMKNVSVSLEVEKLLRIMNSEKMFKICQLQNKSEGVGLRKFYTCPHVWSPIEISVCKETKVSLREET